MFRSQSARGRLEGSNNRAETGTSLRRRRQSATGPLRKGLHYTNWATKEWADSLRSPHTPQSMLEGFGREHARNRPHPSEEFLLRQMPTKKRTASLGEMLLRHTRESFYEDYSTLNSNSGDVNKEVMTQLVKLSFNPSNYRAAAARELEYNPPYPFRLMRGEQTRYDDVGSVDAIKSSGSQTELPSVTSNKKQAVKIEDTPATEQTAGDEEADEDEVFKSTFKSQALPGVKVWLRTASAKDRELAVAALRKANTQTVQDQPASAKIAFLKQPAAEKSKEENSQAKTVGRSQASAVHNHHHHHHHHTAGTCHSCDRRRIHKDYSLLSSSTRLGEEVIPAEMPGNPPPPRAVHYRYQGARYDPKTNSKTVFLASQPPHRSHFAIAPDWPSELVDPQLTRKKKMVK